MPLEDKTDKTSEETAEETKTEESQETTEEEPSEGSDEKDDESSEDSEDEEEDLSEEELKQSKNLFRLLKNPASSRTVIETLAKQAGLIKTEAAASETKKSILDAAKEILGDQYSFLAEKLVKLTDAVVNERLGEVKDRIKVSEEKSLENEIDRALNKLYRDTHGEAKKFESRIIQLMDKYLPSSDTSTEEYIRGLFTIAADEAKTRGIKQTMAKKIARNASDVSRITSQGTEDRLKESGPGKKMTLNEVVNRAYEKLSKG